jgi:hypothetical protein
MGGATCTVIADALIKLEPLLGAAIVLNLAYLNLPEFAYMVELRAIAAERLAKLDRVVVQVNKDTPWFKALMQLATVETRGGLPTASKPQWLNLSGTWGFIYNLLFYRSVGRTVSVIFTAYTLILLMLAVGNEAGVVERGKCGFPQHYLPFDYYSVVVALLWPLAVVCAGQFVLVRCKAYILEHTMGLGQQAEANADLALRNLEQHLNI